MIQKFERVALTVDLPEYGFRAGDVGTVVDITPNGRLVTLEFFNFAGDTVAMIPVKMEQVRPLAADEVMHVRAQDCPE